ncbi:glycosyltransferase family 2 protein [Myxozyma melibiosi]|uniref:Chitin synthase n=1 Tax=Myxozyma melibiosi TaxID=54550 RepID=A0ABR1F0Z7_9ASCO
MPATWKGESYAINTYVDDPEDDDNDNEDDGDSYLDDDDEDILGRPEDATLYAYSDPAAAQNLAEEGRGFVAPGGILRGEDYPEDQDAEDNGVSPVWPAPALQLRRHLTTRKVKFFRGNLVLDCQVSNELLSRSTNSTGREFTHMRYTAATSATPTLFPQEDYTLRQSLYNTPRSTEMFVVVTLYNESDELLARTLKGVFANIYHLCKIKPNRPGGDVWGPDSWKKVVVCVVADGRAIMKPRAKALMAALGCYQEGVAVNKVDEKEVTAHIYEYTTQIGISDVRNGVVSFSDNREDEMKNKACPIQLLFCLKEKNAKKINSHRWFFEAFAPILQPNICVLLDAGTKPGSNSLFHLWYEFYKNPHVGGACGEIKADLGRAGRNLLNPLVAAQNFEYKMSNILDKPLESAFGFISVLPGAFSAYRYTALLRGGFQISPAGDAKLENVNEYGPLDKYFLGETIHTSNAGIFTKNMYLAEDRILCYELVSKRGASWVLHYVKNAHAETDVPGDLAEMILQRRRWLNGSFFAALYSLTHAFNIWRSNHSIFRKLMFHVEFFYQFISILFSWFGLANFFLVFRLLTASVGAAGMGFTAGRYLGVVLEWLYAGCLIVCFVLSLGNKPQGTKKAYLTMVYFFAFLMCYLTFAVIYVAVKSVQSVQDDLESDDNRGIEFKDFFTNSVLRGLILSLGSTYVLYFVASFMFFEFGHMFTSLFQYMLLSPSYINVLNVYAFCNIHDISWGTKGDTGSKNDLGKAKSKGDGESKTARIAVPTRPDEIDEEYRKQCEMLLIDPKQIVEVKSPKQQEDDARKVAEEKANSYYALVRSVVVLTWMVSNFAIVAVVLQTAGLSRLTSSDSDSDSDSSDRQEEISSVYLQVILWTVAALAFVRFVGASFYLVMRFF